MARIQAADRVRTIVISHVPLGEDEEAFHSIRLKVERKDALSKKEEKLLERLVEKAKQWEEAVRSSADTEPENTLGG